MPAAFNRKEHNMERPGLYEVTLLTDRRSDGKQLHCYHLIAPSRQMAIRIAKAEATDGMPEDWYHSIKACAFFHNDGLVKVGRRGRATTEFKTLEARCKAQEREEEQLA